MAGRRYLICASALIWLPLVMSGGSWLLVRTVAAPLFMAYFSLLCLVVSLAVFWLGVIQVSKRRLRVGDLFWMGLYGLGALLYPRLAGALGP
ncbi:MAG: hypothetical protein NZ849_10955 [Meiothermus sp.]|uniref:hypothetical protein n=1 Tax=Meiothermus sp. TaxID=1955249 RepID=UPI0025FE2F4C|nr:hypothetical protein [Meiothermus sp.]MCS7058791.1 hypothetical protein [Meiothermus sp.]MCS7195410.1 hypothetical protein [Meiothermus sp.]MCX7740093.1 hypothetical protein [Meiothermus sp.]MDW8090989.1 hypothetical protein [Meiothermus sp.]MDW8482268.1 hypothetical protein [Meiothermus sp.]